MPSNQEESGPAAGTDVLVAGSGAAGLTAALAAAAGGARVVLAERSAELGGTTALSFGRVWVPASHHAPADRQEAARVYLSGLYSERYQEMTEAFIAAAPAMARFVERNAPLRFVPCRNYPDYHPLRPGAARGGRALDIAPVPLGSLTPLARSVRRPPGYVPLTQAEWEEWRFPRRFDWALLDQRGDEGVLAGGAALAAALLDGAVRAGVRVLAGTRLTSVRVNGGRVAGATVRSGAGVTDIGAAAVILATGGFDRDPELIARFLPGAVTATGAAPGNTGDGLRIAVEAGAWPANAGQGWWMPMIEIPGLRLDGEQFYQSVIRERALPRQILVNAAGRRFADESLPYNELGKAMNRPDPAGGYPNQAAWMIFDEGFRQRYTFPAARPGGDLPGWVLQGGSVAALARSAGLDAGALAGTVERWNRNCAAGTDPDFGRGASAYDRWSGDAELRAGIGATLGPLESPSFHAVEVRSGTLGTSGGPQTDIDGRVLDPRGRVIPGLFAAGNAMAAPTGMVYGGAGGTLGPIITFARRAGVAAAA